MRDMLYICCYCRWSAAAAATAAAAVLLLRVAAVLFCCCCCCSRSPPHGVGRPDIYVFFLLVRHRPPLPRLLCQGQPRACMMCYCCCRYSDAAAMHVLLLCCSAAAAAAAAAMSAICFCCKPPRALLLCKSISLGNVSSHLMAERRIHLLRGYRLAIGIWHLSGGLVPA